MARTPEELREYHRAYYQANKERMRAQTAAYRAEHADEVRAQKAEYYALNKDRIRAEQRERHGGSYSEQARRRAYGLEPGDYDRMLVNQNGVCAACGTDTPGARASTESKHNGFHVDHDHATGKVRGLLCGSCNRALGHVKDDPNRLLALAAYLLQSQDVLHLSVTTSEV